MNDEELMKILIDLEKKGWAKRTDWGGWEITDKAKAFIEKYGKEKAMELFAIKDEELEIEFEPEEMINRTLHSRFTS
jgi:ribosomal protein S19E (S16A)